MYIFIHTNISERTKRIWSRDINEKRIQLVQYENTHSHLFTEYLLNRVHNSVDRWPYRNTPYCVPSQRSDWLVFTPPTSLIVSWLCSTPSQLHSRVFFQLLTLVSPFSKIDSFANPSQRRRNVKEEEEKLPILSNREQL